MLSYAFNDGVDLKAGLGAKRRIRLRLRDGPLYAKTWSLEGVTHGSHNKQGGWRLLLDMGRRSSIILGGVQVSRMPP